MNKITSIGTIRTFGGKSHLAYTHKREDGTERLATACSCKGTANGQMTHGAYRVGEFGNMCKPSKTLLAGDSPIAQFYRDVTEV